MFYLLIFPIFILILFLFINVFILWYFSFHFIFLFYLIINNNHYSFIHLFTYNNTAFKLSGFQKKRSRYSVNAWETGFTQFTFGSLIAVQVLFFQTGLKCNIHKEKLFLLAKGKHDLA